MDQEAPKAQERKGLVSQVRGGSSGGFEVGAEK